MPQRLLPSSAAAFAPRTTPIVVLGAKVPWLMATLRQLSRPRVCPSSITKQERRLREIISPENAVWMLCSVISADASRLRLQTDESPLAEGRLNIPPIHIKAYVVYVDMVWQNEVAFKLTPETIDALVDLHMKLQPADTALDLGERQAQLDNLQKEFLRAANTFMYRTNAIDLVGLNMDGTGELPLDRSEVAKAEILRLYESSMPSPRMAQMLSPVLLSPGVATPWTPEPVYPYRFANSWSTQSAIPTSGTSNHYNPTLGDAMHVDPTRYFSINFARSQVPIPTPYPESATYLPSQLPMYR
ncbi:hypothetical protein N7530_012711 [Penicillium desertorum]|uniref:Uncharacterized protein n=1 Tax=Penicillium desertorum TaxID=1303715 RepID=A0A9X0BFJ2_9EURO|nr:hypothetical protein N7530_012711 [Penicillium desertorum]